jgi:uncharacterized protein
MLMKTSERGHSSARSRALLSLALALGILAVANLRTETAAAQTAAAQSQPSSQDREEAKRLVALGDKLARPADPGRDEAKAAEYYAKAAELGDPIGMLRLGEDLVYGRGVAIDRARGVDLIEASIGAGNTAALVSLSDLIVRGLAGQGNRQRAIMLLEQAGEKGQIVAWVKLGSIYEAGALTRKDDHRAAQYYRKAIAAGRADAMVNLGRALAEQRLKGQGSPADGIALLKQAQERGNDNAVIALSDAYFNGAGVPRSSKQALALLNGAWSGGNVKAGARLVALYRDGRSGSVKPDLQRARVLLTEVSPKLPPQELRNENLLMAVKSASTRLQREAIGSELRQLPVADRSAWIRRARSANPNVYIYLVQEELKRTGILESEPSGMLSGATIRAIYRNCIKYETSDVCRRGPFTPRVVDATSLLFRG